MSLSLMFLWAILPACVAGYGPLRSLDQGNADGGQIVAVSDAQSVADNGHDDTSFTEMGVDDVGASDFSSSDSAGSDSAGSDLGNSVDLSNDSSVDLSNDSSVDLSNDSSVDLGIVCGNGILEEGEDCESPFDDCCHSGTCTFEGPGSTCRPSAGPCDLVEMCSGTTESCPPDLFLPDETPCPGGTCQSGVCQSSVGSDLVLHYTFDDGTATDISGNDNHGTVNGATPTSDAKSGQAMDFDGKDDMVEIGDIDVAGSFTLSAWINFDALGGYHSLVEKMDDYGLWMQSSTVYAEIYDGSYHEATTTVSDTGTWYHLAMTWDGATLQIFRDGVEMDSSPGGHASNNDKLFIGALDGSQEWFNGRIDEVRLYSRALDQAEIQLVMNDLGGSS
jgi:hypothetical protein